MPFATMCVRNSTTPPKRSVLSARLCAAEGLWLSVASVCFSGRMESPCRVGAGRGA